MLQNLLSQVNLNTGLMAMLLAGVITLITALIRRWPHIKRLSINESERLRDDRRADYKEVKDELALLKLRTEASERHSAAVSMRMGQLEFVFGIVMDELETIAPGNEMAKRARTLMVTLYPIPPAAPHIQEFIDELSKMHGSQIPEESHAN